MSADALPGTSRRRRVREGGLAYLLLIPSLVVFGVFVFYPLFRNVYLGFFRSPPFPGLPSTYVGFDQYSGAMIALAAGLDGRNRVHRAVAVAMLVVFLTPVLMTVLFLLR